MWLALYLFSGLFVRLALVLYFIIVLLTILLIVNLNYFNSLVFIWLAVYMVLYNGGYSFN